MWAVVSFIPYGGKNQVYVCGGGAASVEQASVRDPPSFTLLVDAVRLGFLGESERTILYVTLFHVITSRLTVETQNWTSTGIK